MFSSFRAFLISFVLFSFVLSIPFQEQANDKRNNSLKRMQHEYITQDAKLTTEINLRLFVTQLKQDLITLKDNEIRKKYPEILSISKKATHPLSLSEALSFTDKEIKIFSFPSNDGEHSYTLTIPIRKEKGFIQYQVKLKTDMYHQIEKKQQVRMFTVTHLQNNRWKTIPTKYGGKKKLGMNLEAALPNVKPQPNEKGISHYVQNELVIKFKPGTSEQEIQSLLQKYDLTIKKRRDHTVIARSVRQTAKEIIAALNQAHHNILYVEPHFIYLTNKINQKNNPIVPNDSLYLDYQWNLPFIFTEQGWELTKGKENIIIAVIDTGIDLHHPEFQGKLVEGINVIDPKSPPMDDDGHGTHVAGIISANTNNREGIAGITWYNKIMPIKVLDQNGAGTLFDVAEGIFWAVDHGAKVINLSLGNYAESEYLHDAIKYAFAHDVVLVAAAGNDNVDELGFPASYPEVVGVAAIDSFQRRASFSNYGDNIDVTAPGVNIASTYLDHQYAALSGTSMASPHVAALAGLIRSLNPDLTNEEVASIIKETATDLGDPGKDPYYGYGEINIARAVERSTTNKKQQSIFLFWLNTFRHAYR